MAEHSEKYSLFFTQIFFNVDGVERMRQIAEAQLLFLFDPLGLLEDG